MEPVRVKTAVAESDDRRLGPVVLVEEPDLRLIGNLRRKEIQEARLPVMETGRPLRRDVVLGGDVLLAARAEKRKVAELLRVARDHGATRPLEHGKGAGDIALGGFVDDDDIEHLLFEREGAVGVGEVDEPDRESSEDVAERKLLKVVGLLRARAAPERLPKELEVEAGRLL